MSDQVAHLHVHTEFSLLDGAAKIGALFAEASRLGQPAVAMTDHGNLFGAYAFHKEAARHDVKSVIGIEAYLAPGDRTVRKPVYWGTEEQRSIDVGGSGAHTHLTLLAENATGLRNLFRLVSEANLTGRYRKPRVDRELLARHAEGVIATTGCLGSEINTRLRLGQTDAALSAASEMRDIYGDRYYLEVMDHDIAEERALRETLLAVGTALDLPVVATNDSHYVTPGQASAHDALLCVQTRAKLADADRFRFEGTGYHLRSAAEMRGYWDIELPGACDNTLAIAERIGSYDEVFASADRMPLFPLPGDETPDTWLASQVADGLARRYPGGPDPDRQTRANYELGVIGAMGFPGYFLVVADLTRYCREHGIRTNTRGSAAGSIVAYALGITDLDPLAHNLMFERFLNPERVSLPDIDLDVDDSRRGEVVRYLTERWGSERVAQVVTYGRIKAKAALKDATRVLGHPYLLGDRLTKAYPPGLMGFDAPLACVTDPEHSRYGEAAGLREILGAEPEAAEVFELATGLEGLVRQTSVHPSGVVVSRDPLADLLPLWSREDGTLITGFDFVSCDDMGFIKVDVLGSRNLAILDQAVTNIAAHRGEQVDLLSVPLDDPATFGLLARGDTLGVFQLDGGPIRDLLRKLVPTRFGDIGAVIALYRPGPMGANAHNDYADRKNRRKPITPIHPELADVLRPVLGETYGVICYQEQVTQVAQVVAGYSPGRADILRRAMGKKKPAELAMQRPAFFAGMSERGFSEEAAGTLWDILVPFSAYAFCRAHAASYAMVGYWTAYLKVHYPGEYMAALLTSVADDQDRMAVYLAEARRMGLTVLTPDVTESGRRFTVTSGGIRVGLDAVRGVGETAAAEIVTAREDGPYRDVADFLVRTGTGKVAMDGLVKAGAFDAMGHSRRALHGGIEAAVNAASAVRKIEALGHFDYLGDDLGDLSRAGLAEVPAGDEWPRDVLLAHEREALGLYVSSHPLAGWEEVIAEHRDTAILDLAAGDTSAEREVTVAGLLSTVTAKTTRAGHRWASVVIEDLEASVEVLVFPRAYRELAPLLAVDAVVAITARVQIQDETVRLVAAKVVALECEVGPTTVTLDVGRPDAATVERLDAVLAAHSGDAPVRLTLANGLTLAVTGRAVAPSPKFWSEVTALGLQSMV